MVGIHFLKLGVSAAYTEVFISIQGVTQKFWEDDVLKESGKN